MVSVTCKSCSSYHCAFPLLTDLGVYFLPKAGDAELRTALEQLADLAHEPDGDLDALVGGKDFHVLQ